MESFKENIREILPGELHEMVSREWIPWKWVEHSYADLPRDIITAHFYAYQLVDRTLEVEALASKALPDTGACLRCGTCCTIMSPGGVSASRHRKWRENGALIAQFYTPRKKKRNSSFTCWFHNGVRLRMCPLLCLNQVDGSTFCVVYHQGDKFRAPTCARFRPNPPRCDLPLAMMMP